MTVIISGTDGVSDVDGTAGTPALRGTDANTGIFFGADQVGVATNGVERVEFGNSETVFNDGGANVDFRVEGDTDANLLFVDASADRVGIGTNAPTSKLHVAAASDPTITIQNTAESTMTLIAGGNGQIRSTTNLDVFTGGTLHARITSDGELLVGTTSMIQSGFVSISVDQSVRNGIVVNDTFTGGGTNSQILFRRNSSGVGSITSNTTSTAYNTSSDYRLKHDIAPMTGALAKVAQLKPCTYTWKVDGSAGQGFIAHELQAVVPDCVTGEKDAFETYTDAEGNEQTRPVHQGVDTSFLVATLTAAIQELSAKNDALEARIAALEAQ